MRNRRILRIIILRMLGRRSRNLMFWWMVFFAMIAGFVLTGMKVFGQGGPVVQYQPLIDLEGIFEPLSQWFTDFLKEYWLILLSIFSVWFMFRISQSMLDGRFERVRAEIIRQERIQSVIDKIEDKKTWGYTEEEPLQVTMQDLKEDIYKENNRTIRDNRQQERRIKAQGLEDDDDNRRDW